MLYRNSNSSLNSGTLTQGTDETVYRLEVQYVPFMFIDITLSFVLLVGLLETIEVVADSLRVRDKGRSRTVKV